MAQDAQEPAQETTPQVSHAMEDYLKAIYTLDEEGGVVTTQRLSEQLGVTGPSVTNMVKRLDEFHLVQHAKYHGVELTPAGVRIALEVIRHHRLLELYLAETLGYGWDEVHAEAERLEHHLSEALEARLDSALGYPTRDPHGDPIPSRKGEMEQTTAVPLGSLQAGQRGIVSRVSDRDPGQLRFLGGLGLFPGVAVTVVERMPFDDLQRIVVAGKEHIIGKQLAASVQLDPVEPE